MKQFERENFVFNLDDRGIKLNGVIDNPLYFFLRNVVTDKIKGYLKSNFTESFFMYRIKKIF